MWQLLPQLKLIEELLRLSLCKIWLQSHAMVDMVYRIECRLEEGVRERDARQVLWMHPQNESPTKGRNMIITRHAVIELMNE